MQRYIAECMSGRGSSDVAAHPLGSAESDDAEDLTQEIRESLADQGEQLSRYWSFNG